MFNRRGIRYHSDVNGNPLYRHGESYIVLSKWSEFCYCLEYCIDLALKNRGEWKQFNIVKNIDENRISRSVLVKPGLGTSMLRERCRVIHDTISPRA